MKLKRVVEVVNVTQKVNVAKALSEHLDISINVAYCYIRKENFKATSGVMEFLAEKFNIFFSLENGFYYV